LLTFFLYQKRQIILTYKTLKRLVFSFVQYGLLSNHRQTD